MFSVGFKQLHWTEHSKAKMRQYSLSKSRLLRVLYNPKRKEEGIVPGTIAVMQPAVGYAKKAIRGHSKSFPKKRKKTSEVWLMYQDVGKIRKIISAWRYPGVSPVGGQIPIPEDIRQELINNKIV